ncbi:hypothetical protein J4Q44_G00043600 [Coregonus suidteri]|uniref:Uncharacterized protein n=1 Tax=Coregonus suidteri TaxID=861788 RepID=A0AAN8M5Q0_9TELE
MGSEGWKSAKLMFKCRLLNLKTITGPWNKQMDRLLCPMLQLRYETFPINATFTYSRIM